MNARLLTGSSLVAALKKAVDPAISALLQRNAERLRAAFEEDRHAPSPLPEGEVGPQGRVRVYGLSGRSALDIAIAGQAMFAREFGTLDAPADPVIAPAIDRLKRRSR